MYNGIRKLGWHLDYRRFRIWLIEKYNVDRAYIFLGFIADQQGLYDYLRRAGFILIFKTTVPGSEGKLKGNCDAEMVLKAIVDFYENRFAQAVLISGDGDFACLATFLLNRKALKTVIAQTARGVLILSEKFLADAFMNVPFFLMILNPDWL